MFNNALGTLLVLQVFIAFGNRLPSGGPCPCLSPFKYTNKVNETLHLSGPRVTISCFRDIQFHIYKADGTAVGSTCKRWQGLLHALFLAPVTDR